MGLELGRVLREMDERHWLIWTSRPAPLQAGLRRIHREHGLERFPQPAEVQVDAAALGVEEKALILFRHAKAAALPPPAVELVRAHGWSIVSHPHFTPERIRRFVRGRLLGLAAENATRESVGASVAAEIREPTEAMAASLGALAPEYRAVLVALLDAPPDPVSERDLAAAVRRHSERGVPQTPAELVDRLTDHFVRHVPPTRIAWVHPSWRDLVISELARDAAARRSFLERSGLDGIMLALSVAGGASGDRVLPLLREDGDWDVLTARLADLLPVLDGPEAVRLLGSLEAALDLDLPARERVEAEALAAFVLECMVSRWSGGRSTLAVASLEAWLRVASRLPEPPPRPQVAPLWIELQPGDELVHPQSREELVRLDEWLALASVLHSFAPDELERLGFPARFHGVLAGFVGVAAACPEDVEELVTQILSRLRRIAPAYAPAAARAAHALAAKDEPWFEVRFETHPRRPEPAATDRVLVERVLRDLA